MVAVAWGSENRKPSIIAASMASRERRRPEDAEKNGRREREELRSLVLPARLGS